ncbi:DExH-box ATP-dependent RNA helicase DExH12-like [Vicia villosa]|uniref:DExH-box ATP-dependent RNA helicase DExH12-like n=1 Tax=Vicia villosa TaxID=3911 RepID=UPI00273C623D|nr:DExH-box ATP-dependent RNA helicase DExH12-like [Vicia villosa]
MDPLNPFPMDLTASIQPITSCYAVVELKINPTFTFEWNSQCLGIHVVVENPEAAEGQRLVYRQASLLNNNYIGEPNIFTFAMPMLLPRPSNYIIQVRVDSFNFFSGVLTLPVDHLTFPGDEIQPVELMKLESLLPINSLIDAPYEDLYKKQFKYFNPIQIKVFPVIYHSDDNVFVAAPPGSGKTVCAELAILRNHKHKKGTIVYIAPVQALAHKRYVDWEEKFRGLDLNVAELTGDIETDVELLQTRHLIISIPPVWDALSRQWKQVPVVQQVSLFIVDDLHFMGLSKEGHILESILVRMNHVASQMENKFRMVAFSASLANGKDMGEWIGASSRGLFNFSRHVPLELSIKPVKLFGTHIYNSTQRFKERVKSTFLIITQNANNGDTTLVYAPTEDHLFFTVMELNRLLENKPLVYVQPESLKTAINEISDSTLKRSLSCGISYLHEDMNPKDQDIVSDLYKAGLIRVCILNSSMCWRVSMVAHQVVVMGTGYDDYDGPNLPLVDIFQMSGQAGRYSVDSVGKFTIMCHPGEESYYRLFLEQSCPVESRLHQSLLDILNAETVCGNIANMQDAMNYLAQTFMCQRLEKNPSYYHCHIEVGSYLELLIERSFNELITDGVVLHHGGLKLSPSDLGRIASDTYLSCKTIVVFSRMLTQESDVWRLLEILCSAYEYKALLPNRRVLIDDKKIKDLFSDQIFAENANFNDPHVRANALLQTYFSRIKALSSNLIEDRKEVVLLLDKLLVGLIEVASKRGWVSLMKRATNIRAMTVHAIWHNDDSFLQLPYFTRKMVTKCRENNILSFSDLCNSETQYICELLRLRTFQWLEITRLIKGNQLPLNYSVKVDGIIVGGKRTVDVELSTKRSGDEIFISSPFYPGKKREKWWVFVEDAQNQLLTYRLVSPWAYKGDLAITLRFTVPVQPETTWYNITFISDSMKGITKRRVFHVKGYDIE